MRRNLALGAMGEELAAKALTEAGMQILDRNWRCRHGELDLVAVDGDAVVFVEVKTRSGLGYGTPAESVTYAKQRRIRMLAQRWLAASDRHWPAVRFDVVSVLVDRRGEPAVSHLPAVF
ncbi:YraN family protein [Rhodococcus sp. SGAir0479]|uniref:YraN family protein n=1 Tax=Rhodococcus sp. SGAir0479 TaxID=2567884 RepID=UPI0010CCB7A7|nr:YraN family protein [Rhodococcus sp. SGAir0479]QCQ90632.1 YraN family protein [Rhodococcus sp. SGAir0479]